MSESPGTLSCSRGGRELVEIGTLLASLASHSIAPPERTERGYRLTLAASAEVAQVAREFVRLDCECCPFLDFELRPGADALVLEVRGPKEARGVLDLSFELARGAAGEAQRT